MQYRKIGKWGVKVSEVALGSWLTYGNTVDVSETTKQVERAYGLGINFFDTANVYANGRCEEVVGAAIKPLRRDGIVLATKVFFPMGNGPNDRGLSRKHIFEQCHLSLRRLKTDYIDLYQCHRYDPKTPMQEVVRTMDDLARQGKILYWGVSKWPAEMIEQAVLVADDLNALPPISNQPQYNMFSRNIEEKVIPVSSLLGLGQVVFSPLAQGVLTGKYTYGKDHPKDSRATDNRANAFMTNVLTKQNLEMVERLKPIAAELGISMSQLALAWCLRLPEISSVIIGATKVSQIDDNVKTSGVHLEPAILKRIEDVLKNAIHAK